jgi:hypothetical protein
MTVATSCIERAVRPCTKYPTDLLHQLQDALAQLADIEFHYEAGLERLDVWRPRENERRQRLRVYLDARRSRERIACQQRLRALEERINYLMGFPREGESWYCPPD